MSKEKDQYVNVFVRVKPLSQKEIGDNGEGKDSAVPVVQVVSDKDIVVQSSEKAARKFTFDRVFGPVSTQMEVYNTVVSPLLKEVMAGYNCTVFAYGQTGTGKTYTMKGDHIEDPCQHWQNNSSAGMIPRCLSHMFDELELLSNQQYVVRVNFLELYNEELFDLLSPSSHDATKLKLYEDTSKKGSVIIHGLEEVTVRNKTEVYKILEKGSERRQTATTLMNANSSRSHTVFSITIHMKEDIIEGEELLKISKLNLVDLAGSENVGKSGAVNKRARETRNINQSLLTLGRVITALVEKAPHIPYRESKLTRLLQESLGGRTKTSIIATVSSAWCNIEEILSTLDYAQRAKQITNRPEINQKLYKRALLREYTEEVERLRKDLKATRDKNGIYLSQDKYESMHALIDWQKKKIAEKINNIKMLEENMENKQKIFSDLQSQHNAQLNELTTNINKLNNLEFALQLVTESLKKAEDDRNEQKYIVETYVANEKILHDQTEILLNIVNEASENVQKLHEKLDRKRNVEEENAKLELQIRSDSTKNIKNIEDCVITHTKDVEQFFSFVKSEIETYIAAQTENIEASILPIINDMIHERFNVTKESTKNINTMYEFYEKSLKGNIQNTSSVIEYEKRLLVDVRSKFTPSIHDILEDNKNFIQNIQAISNHVCEKLDNVSTHVKNTIETAYKNQLDQFTSLRENINEIEQYVNNIFLNQKQVIKNHKTFAKKIEDLSREFILLDKCEEYYSENINMYHEIDKVCNNTCKQVVQSYNADINTLKNFKEFIQDNISEMKNKLQNVNDNMIQNDGSTKSIIEKKTALINNVQNSLHIGSVAMKQYKNNAKFNMWELQQKMIKDKNEIITANNNTSEILENMKFIHDKFMEQQQDQISNFLQTINDKLTTKNIKLNNWNNETIKKLHISQQQINKFFTEDLRHDVATGTTPPRKKFSYPLQVTKTPIHEILLQRFREDKNKIETAEDSNLTSINKVESKEQLPTPNIQKNNKVMSIKDKILRHTLSYNNLVPKQLNKAFGPDVVDESILNVSDISISSHFKVHPSLKNATKDIKCVKLTPKETEMRKQSI